VSQLQLPATLLIVLAVFDVIVTAILVLAARRLKETALEERATASVVLTLAAVLVAILAGAYLGEFDLPTGTGTILLFGGLILISVPQLVWFVAYARGAFK
jgi:hypothetical protein